MAYVPPHRRAAARLGRVDENSTVVSPSSQAGSNCCGTSTVVSTTPTEPGLIYHDGVPPDRVVDLSHLRAEPEDDISPDDSVSVAGERWGWHQRQPASGGGGGGGGGSSHVALGDVRGGGRALDLRSGVTGVSGGLVGGGGGAQQRLPHAPSF